MLFVLLPKIIKIQTSHKCISNQSMIDLSFALDFMSLAGTSSLRAALILLRMGEMGIRQQLRVKLLTDFMYY